MLKIRISDLDSTLKGFCANLRKTSEKLKIRISDLKSEGWNFTKFGKVKKDTTIRLIAPFLLQLFSDILTNIT